jgi:hypothetical protein
MSVATTAIAAITSALFIVPPLAQAGGGDGVHDPVERDTRAPVRLRDVMCGIRLELTEAGLVVRDDRRSEVPDSRSIPAHLRDRRLELLERAQERVAVETGEIALDDEDHAGHATRVGSGAKSSELLGFGGRFASDREPVRERGARVDSQLAVHVGEVRGDGVLADEQRRRDLLVRVPLRREFRHAPFCLGQVLRRAPAADAGEFGVRAVRPQACSEMLERGKRFLD